MSEVAETSNISVAPLTNNNKSVSMGELQNIHDAAQIYQIKTKISATKQGNRSVTEYSNCLKSLWQEMDHYQWIQMKCSEDAAIHKRYVEEDRIYNLLAGLNIKFDALRAQVLGKEELPSLDEVIAIFLAEEGRRGVTIETQRVESSALVSRNTTTKNYSFEQHVGESNGQAELSKLFNKDSLWCTWCKKPRHTKEKCWILHGKPQAMNKTHSKKGGQSNGQRQVHMAITDSWNEDPTHVEFNKEEIEKLKGTPAIQAAGPPAPACSAPPQPDTTSFSHLAVNQAPSPVLIQNGDGGGSLLGTISQGVGSPLAHTNTDTMLGPGVDSAWAHNTTTDVLGSGVGSALAQTTTHDVLGFGVGSALVETTTNDSLGSGVCSALALTTMDDMSSSVDQDPPAPEKSGGASLLGTIGQGLFSIGVASALVHKAIDVALGPGVVSDLAHTTLDIYANQHDNTVSAKAAAAVGVSIGLCKYLGSGNQATGGREAPNSQKKFNSKHSYGRGKPPARGGRHGASTGQRQGTFNRHPQAHSGAPKFKKQPGGSKP
ncbi:uncharacterized protein LOC110625052 isoform X2 [Manihot esculenta]|uniref:Uncharacterized protein n=1 Tax=Manihot esculenta TaxID=3983 RepID=A0A251K0Z3_MANES|nr:uncharacterized protein LOC110625052 isoform X2 [Manihot esculenta]